jgi:N-acetylmuramic acid 6-phosphate etherase
VKTTESDSEYKNPDQMDVLSILENINNEDNKVASSVKRAINQIENLVEAALRKMQMGGRLLTSSMRPPN